MIYTCDNCHYTFEAETLPASCPDCGKETVNRRFGDKILPTPAVREATEREAAWLVETRAELAAEEEQKRRLQSVDSYDMTDDEHNWAMVMIHEMPAPSTEEASRMVRTVFRSLHHDPAKMLEHYIQIRKQFTRKISDDRADLEKAGKDEPISIARFTDEGETVLLDGLDVYVSALSVLYHFRPYDFLHTPTLGDLRRIDLKKIAEEPGAGYIQFLLDFEGEL